MLDPCWCGCGVNWFLGGVRQKLQEADKVLADSTVILTKNCPQIVKILPKDTFKIGQSNCKGILKVDRSIC